MIPPGRPPKGRYRNSAIKPAWYRMRQKTITPSQKRAERMLWPLFGLAFSFDSKINIDAAFGRTHSGVCDPTGLHGNLDICKPRSKLVLEIGCGSGEALTTLAAAHPSADFLGCDWFRAGLAVAMQSLHDQGLTNARLVRADAATFLTKGIAVKPYFDEVLVFFPDPWYSSEERRMIRMDVIEALSPLMRDGGILHLATDVPGYADKARAVLADSVRVLDSGLWTEVDGETLGCMRRPSTKYERDGIAAGRAVEDVFWVYSMQTRADPNKLEIPV